MTDVTDTAPVRPGRASTSAPERLVAMIRDGHGPTRTLSPVFRFPDYDPEPGLNVHGDATDVVLSVREFVANTADFAPLGSGRPSLAQSLGLPYGAPRKATP